IVGPAEAEPLSERDRVRLVGVDERDHAVTAERSDVIRQRTQERAPDTAIAVLGEHAGSNEAVPGEMRPGRDPTARNRPVALDQHEQPTLLVRRPKLLRR